MLCWTCIAARWGCDMLHLFGDNRHLDPTQVESVVARDDYEDEYVVTITMRSGATYDWTYSYKTPHWVGDRDEKKDKAKRWAYHTVGIFLKVINGSR